jgi:hypothetical protein
MPPACLLRPSVMFPRCRPKAPRWRARQCPIGLALAINDELRGDVALLEGTDYVVDVLTATSVVDDHPLDVFELPELVAKPGLGRLVDRVPDLTNVGFGQLDHSIVATVRALLRKKIECGGSTASIRRRLCL